MTRLRTTVIAIFALAAVLLAIPAAAMAAHPAAKAPNRHPAGMVFGTLQQFDQNSATIQTKAGPVNVALEPVMAYVAYDQADAVAGLKDGDQVAAYGHYYDGTLRAERLRYATSPFAVSKLIRFSGHYESSDSTANTLTINLRKGVDITFNVDKNTRYFDNGKRVTAPNYLPHELIRVWARQFSDQSWLAKVVNTIHHK